MARTFARIYTTVWNDPEFRALGPAQHTYFLILAQPKLSLVGCIDMKPRSWSAMSGLTTGQIASQIDTPVHRPLGPDGKHGTGRHTPTCGCVDKTYPEHGPKEE